MLRIVIDDKLCQQFLESSLLCSVEWLHHNYATAWRHLSQTGYLACSCNPYPLEVWIWISERWLLWQVYRSPTSKFLSPSTRYSCIFLLCGQLSCNSRWRTWRGENEEIRGHLTPWTITLGHSDSHHSVSIVALFSIWYLPTDTSWLSICVFYPKL